MGYNKEHDMKRFIAWVISIFMFCCLVLTIFFMIFYRSPTPIHPCVSLTIEKDDDSYILYIENCSDPEKALKLSDVDIYVRNGTGSGDQSNVIASYKLADILNDEDSNVTFYDKDNNDRLSVGDEFMVSADIITQETYFSGTYRKTGGTVFSRPLN